MTAVDEEAAHQQKCILHEDDILRATRQYDIEVVYEAVLRSRGLVSLGSAFSRCRQLVVLDVSRNALVSLSGVQMLADTLTTLNAAENAITNIDDLRKCTQLQRIFLEGNQLQSRAAIEPLSQIPRLREVYFRREVSHDDGGSSLVLGNPICTDIARYAQILSELFSHVRWVDGELFCHCAAPHDAKSQNTQASDVATAKETSINNMMAVTSEALRTTDAETNLKKLLSSLP